MRNRTMCTGCALLFVAISLNLCEAENNRVVAWIGCRAGSRRLPNKNTLPFVGEETLIHVKLQQLLNVPDVDFVVFSSDDEKALQIAKEYEKQRPEKLAVLWRDECFKESVQPRQELCATEGECDADSCTSSEYMQFIARRLKGAPYDAAHIIYTPVTAPMYNESAISQQIRAHLREPNRGVVPVTSMSGYFYHREKPLTFSPDNCVATQRCDCHASHPVMQHFRRTVADCAALPQSGRSAMADMAVNDWAAGVHRAHRMVR